MTEVAPRSGRRARREAENRAQGGGHRHVAPGALDPAAASDQERGPGHEVAPGHGAHADRAALSEGAATLFWPRQERPAGPEGDQPLTGYPPAGIPSGAARPAGSPAPGYPSAKDATRNGYPPGNGYAGTNGYPVTAEDAVAAAPARSDAYAVPLSYPAPGEAPANGYAVTTGYPPGAAPAYSPSFSAPAPVSAPPTYAYAPAGGYAEPASPVTPQDAPPAGGSAPSDVPQSPGERMKGVRAARPAPAGALRGRHATQWNQGFGRVVGWTLLGGLIPGTGLIAAGRRVIGWLILALCLLPLVGALVLLLAGNPVSTISHQVLAHPERLTYAAEGVVALAVLWAVHLIATHVSLRRFAELTGGQRVLSLVLVSTLVIGGIGSALFSGKQILLGRDTVTSIFSGTPLSATSRRPDTSGNVADPWAGTPRMNVLLIGSDAGADRTGLRTDSLMLASIDTKTGETVLFGVPRNLEHVPFPPGSQQAADYPQGFFCPQHACLINALWQFGEQHATTYYKGDKDPGLTATVQGVEQALGLTVDNYAMLDLRGFMSFVNAVGGLTINVTKPIPVGGHRDPATGIATGVTSYIQPGRQKLNGYDALWYARSRSDSDDYERMRRQRCVIGAITQQVDPQTVALNLPAILQAAKDNIRTSIPVSDIDAWVTLTLRVKKSHVRSLPFTNAVIDSADPDFAKIHELVQTAIQTPSPVTSATPSASASVSPSATGKTTTTKPAATTDPNTAVDVTSVC